MTDLQTAKDLRAAADLLRTNGWHQGASYGPNGRVCAAQAIARMSTDGMDAHEYAACLGLRKPTEEEMESLWKGPVPHKTWSDLPDTIPGWNDAPGRTKEEVLDRLESGALALEVRALAHESTASLEPVRV